MYEIWLALNIVWEIALEWWLPITVAALVWLVLIAVAAARGTTRWRSGLRWALAIGVLVAAATFLATPGLTRSSLAELAYWIDWINLLAIAAAAGAVATAMSWPIVAMRLAPART
jgi:hypothetical protein